MTPGTRLSIGELLSLNLDLPVSKIGLAGSLEAGTLKLPISVPKRSPINLTAVTLASALLLAPLRIMLGATNPANSGFASSAKLKVSIFRTVEVSEYVSGILSFLLYGFLSKISVGLLYGPYL